MKTQKGNVLFVVLAAIALFAGLVMAMTRSDNTDSGAVLSQAEAKLHAASIMRFGSDVEQAVRRLTTIGGCDIEEVSFERAPFDGSDTDYVNPNSPSDKSCHVFHSNGGQVEYITFEDKWKDESYRGEEYFNKFGFMVSCVEGIGNSPTSLGHAACNGPLITADNAEVVLFVGYLKESICKEISQKFYSTSTIPIEYVNAVLKTARFVGDFSINTAYLKFDGALDKFNGFGSGCYISNSNGNDAFAANSYVYYNVLYAR